jgi:uncharacterized protein with NAD-binding domain and iron-sulfur cluster
MCEAEMSERLRVLVLGGGMAGISAAFRLSDTPDKRERFRVTLLQHGWRLGGKGATGRDAGQHQRIEEHGLHVWMGFYVHAFALVRDALDSLPPPLGGPGAIRDTFVPDHAVALADTNGRWSTIRLPPRPGLPWDPAQRDWPTFMLELTRWAVGTLRGEISLSPAPLARLAVCIARGLLVDVLPFGERGFERIDRWDLREWLRRHGARDAAVLDCPPILAFYALSFAHADGRGGPGRGSVAAGAALRSIARILFGYHGAPFWRMPTGMGDGVFVPLYRALVQHGVNIEWFTRVEALLPARDAPRIDAITIRRQATPRGEYQPLIHVRGRPAWPSLPRYEQLVDGEQLRGLPLESYDCQHGQRETLRIGEHFDLVVLAIPIDAHRTIAPALLDRSEPLRMMVDHHRSVATRSLQVWLRSDPTNETIPTSEPHANIGSGLPPPYSSWGDLREVIEAEDWPAHARPTSLYYFVDVCPDPTGDHEDARVAAEFVRDDLSRCLPGASARDLACPPYSRINAGLGERYILTPPGSTRFRLPPGGSGIQNLFLAGDWTRTSIDGGSIEAAAESGVLAAHSIIERFASGRRQHP